MTLQGSQGTTFLTFHDLLGDGRKICSFYTPFPTRCYFYDLFQLFATKIKFMVLNFECYFEYSMIYVVHVIFLGIIVVQSRFTYIFFVPFIWLLIFAFLAIVNTWSNIQTFDSLVCAV